MTDLDDRSSPAVENLRAMWLTVRSSPVLIGLLSGPCAAFLYLAGGLAFDTAFGRPSPTQWASTFLLGLPILAIGLAVLGAVAGLIVLLLRRLSGRTDAISGRSVFLTGMVIAGLAIAAGVERGRQTEMNSRPRVFESISGLVRQPGPIPSGPVTAATIILAADPPPSDPPLPTVVWHAEPVRVSVDGGTLAIHRGDRPVDAVDISDFDYVHHVRAVVATLDESGEWLALLADLRATSHRSLLLIYDPSGALVHKELLERYSSRPRTLPLAATGKLGQRQAFIVDVGRPVRYGLRQAMVK